MMIWFDTHAHLQDNSFSDDLADVLDRAKQAGVHKILLPSVDLSDAGKAMALAGTDDVFCCAIGCHPHEASDFPEDGCQKLESILDSCDRTKVVAIGEIGLDYHYDFSPRKIQQAVFRNQLEFAFSADLPVIIHEREATADSLSILHEQTAKGMLRDVPGVFHCYSGSAETAQLLLDMGFYIGVDGPLTFKNAKKTPEVIRTCPKDRLILETDSPYLAPVPHRGKRNEPAYLHLIAERVAQIWEVPVSEVSAQTTKNACRLFGLDIGGVSR